MEKNKIKLTFYTFVSVVVTWLLFELFFYVTSLGYVSIGDSYCKLGPIPAKYASFDIAFKSNYTGQLTLIDKGGNQLSNTDYTVIVEGRTVCTSFKAPGKRLVNIKIRGNSNKVAGRTFVRVRGGGPLITHYYFNHHSNPFVYYLMALITILAFVTVLWFVFLQKQFYPRFRAIRKTIIIPNQAPVVIKFKGARMVVLDNVMHKQSLIDKLIKGKVSYITIPNIKSQIQLTPRNKGKSILFINKKLHYVCLPNPIGIEQSIISDNTNKEQFKII